jgi:Domain of unknown function (DUF397)
MTSGNPGAVMVRDTQNRDGNVLSVSPSAWRAFVSSVR